MCFKRILPISCVAFLVAMSPIRSQAADPTPAIPMTPASAPVQIEKAERLTELIEHQKQVVLLLEASADARTGQQAIANIDAITDRLKQFDEKLQAGSEHWKWTVAERIPLDDEKIEEKFVIDPELENGSAIAFQCKNGKVRIDSIQVIDARGISTVIKVDETFSTRDGQKTIRYLHYPTEISTIIVTCATEKDARGRLNVWAGVTDLPEYAKEAQYWLTMAKNDLKSAKPVNAAEYVKRAIVKTYLFRLSRRVQ